MCMGGPMNGQIVDDRGINVIELQKIKSGIDFNTPVNLRDAIKTENYRRHVARFEGEWFTMSGMVFVHESITNEEADRAALAAAIAMTMKGCK